MRESLGWERALVGSREDTSKDQYDEHMGGMLEAQR